MEEIYVETIIKSISGIRPFGHHKALRILFLQKLTDFTPEKLRLILIGIEELLIASYSACFHQGTRHICTEAVTSHIHPEPKHLL